MSALCSSSSECIERGRPRWSATGRHRRLRPIVRIEGQTQTLLSWTPSRAAERYANSLMLFQKGRRCDAGGGWKIYSMSAEYSGMAAGSGLLLINAKDASAVWRLPESRIQSLDSNDGAGAQGLSLAIDTVSDRQVAPADAPRMSAVMNPKSWPQERPFLRS